MKKWLFISVLGVLASAWNVSVTTVSPAGSYEDSLRALYTKPTAQWPAPSIDPGVQWTELGVVPESPLKPRLDSLKDMIELGKKLFFDPRLSGSNQISCASCHVPDLSWTDGREKSVGHDQQTNKRNSPTLLNVWFYKKLFWDGRSNSLEDQAFSPINSESEMHSNMGEMIGKLEDIKGYEPLFAAAFGNSSITPEKITTALAYFQRTIVSRKSDFDDFVLGKKEALTDAALRGLHLFRTKARCMNCHNGPLLSDNAFHNVGLTYYGREYEDLGLYKVTRRAADVGKFKTPSLRDVIRTRPWMHNGLFDNIEGVMNMYNAGMPQLKPKPEQIKDTLFPITDPLLKKLNLTKEERLDVIAFLNAITTEPLKVRMPVLPK
jgi:cytochrome c peroxidase